MKSAVEACADAHEAGPAHGRGRCKPLCACCTPELPAVQAGRPQLRASTRPVLAWRTRLAALPAHDKSH